MVAVVTLIAGDGGQIKIREDELCKYSSVCRMLLDPAYGFEESQTKQLFFKDLKANDLRRVAEYIQSRVEAEAHPPGPYDVARAFQVHPSEALELLLIADFLDL